MKAALDGSTHLRVPVLDTKVLVSILSPVGVLVGGGAGRRIITSWMYGEKKLGMVSKNTHCSRPLNFYNNTSSNVGNKNAKLVLIHLKLAIKYHVMWSYEMVFNGSQNRREWIGAACIVWPCKASIPGPAPSPTIHSHSYSPYTP